MVRDVRKARDMSLPSSTPRKFRQSHSFAVAQRGTAIVLLGLLLQACPGGDSAEACTTELRFPITARITRLGRDVDAIIVRVGGNEHDCGNWQEPDASADPVEYRCAERGGGTYTVRVESGELSWTRSVEIEADECHARSQETLTFVLDEATAERAPVTEAELRRAPAEQDPSEKDAGL